MTSIRAALLALLVVLPSTASALVPGGGPSRSDCYAEWQVTTPEVVPSRGKVRVDCQDGDPACDVDGERNGTCVMGVSICLFQSDVPGCTPQDVTEVRLSAAKLPGLAAPVPSPGTPVCGPATLVTLPLRGKRASKPLKAKLTAISSGRPKRDVDHLVLRCVPNRGAAQCPANPAGGAREIMLSVDRDGTDLDNGWTGTSHNFPIVFGTTLRMCLAGCDPSTNPRCTEDEAATELVNGRTFGPPLPLLAAGIPVCLVSRFSSPKVTQGFADLQSGEIAATINLLSDVYLTNATQICPRCSGGAIGAAGTCDIGARQGQSCRVGGELTVPNAPGPNRTFRLSADCPPAGSPAGTVTIALPMTTGSSTLPGPRPCNASQDDQCAGGTCSSTCSGAACLTTTADGCIDTKGGVSQLCCSSDTTRPCFPTAGGGQIVRTGTAAPPAPAWPDATYPKTSSATLVGTFCEGATGAVAVDGTTGLPGPGALTFPLTAEWIQ